MQETARDVRPGSCVAFEDQRGTAEEHTDHRYDEKPCCSCTCHLHTSQLETRTLNPTDGATWACRPRSSTPPGSVRLRRRERSCSLSRTRPDRSVRCRTPLEAIAQFIGGGLFGLLIWWGNGKLRMPVDDVDATFRRLAIPSLKVAG
jgi:hypothetical protein